MRLPLFAVPLLPEKLRNKYIRHIWDTKTDDEIWRAFFNNIGWIELSLGDFEARTIINISNDCIRKLDEYIMPQMIKRDLVKEIYNVDENRYNL